MCVCVCLGERVCACVCLRETSICAGENTDGAAVGGGKFPGAASKVAGAPLGSCRFVSMDATAKPYFSYGSRLTLMAERFNASPPD